MTAAVIIQARMGSSRLPGKTLETLGAATVLDWVVTRSRLADRVDEIIVATSDDPIDDPIGHFCESREITCIRGDSLDVLERYQVALLQTTANEIVRITADCPLLDPGIVDLAIATRRDHDLDYVSTSLDGRYPRGLDVEVVRRSVLETAASEATDPDEREHVTLFVYRRPERFSCAPVVCPSWAQHPELRITVDEIQDLEVVRKIVDGLGIDATAFRGEEIMSFLINHPEIALINQGVEHRHVY